MTGVLSRLRHLHPYHQVYIALSEDGYRRRKGRGRLTFAIAPLRRIPGKLVLLLVSRGRRLSQRHHAANVGADNVFNFTELSHKFL